MCGKFCGHLTCWNASGGNPLMLINTCAVTTKRAIEYSQAGTRNHKQAGLASSAAGDHLDREPGGLDDGDDLCAHVGLALI